MTENPFASPQTHPNDPLEPTEGLAPILADPQAFVDPDEYSSQATTLIVLNVLLVITIAVFDAAPLFRNAPPIDEDAVEATSNSQGGSDAWTKILNLSFLITSIAYMRWQRVASKNLKALGSRFPRFSPGWNVGCWFVPIANFYWPYQAVVEIWRLSEPNIDPDKSAPSVGPGVGIFGWWWAGWILWLFAPATVLFGLLWSDKVSEDVVVFATSLTAALCSVLTGYFAIMGIRSINERQHARRQNLILATAYSGPAFSASVDEGPNFVS